MDKRFTDIIQLIKQSRTNAIRAVNAELINLYWNVGEYVSTKLEKSEWGESVVADLANYIKYKEPEIKGFSDKNIWRMKQFYETYKDFPKLSALVREISWTHNLAIFSRCKTSEEREFYLKITKEENYSSRELERQISASLFEQKIIGNEKLSAVLRVFNQDISTTFKDSYVFDFLNLPENHNESELKRGLVKQMKNKQWAPDAPGGNGQWAKIKKYNFQLSTKN
jgi:predicted nuclease of restriction endonuclease-like (RecB) superfamily